MMLYLEELADVFINNSVFIEIPEFSSKDFS